MDFLNSQNSGYRNNLQDPYGLPPPSAYVPVDPFKPSIAFSLKNVFRRGRGEEPLGLEDQVDESQPFRILKKARTKVGFGEKQGYRPERLGPATLEAVIGAEREGYRPTKTAAYPGWESPTPSPKRRKRLPGVVFNVAAPHQHPPPVFHPSDAFDGDGDARGRPWYRPSYHTQALGPAVPDVVAPHQHPPPVSPSSDALNGDSDAMGGSGRPSWYRPSRYAQALGPTVLAAGDEENQMPPLVDSNSESNVSQSQDREPRPRPTIYPASLRSSPRRLDSSVLGRHDFSDDSPYALIPPESWAVTNGNVTNPSIEPQRPPSTPSLPSHRLSTVGSVPSSASPPSPPLHFPPLTGMGVDSRPPSELLSLAASARSLSSRTSSRSRSPSLPPVPSVTEQETPVRHGLNYSRYDALALSASSKSPSPARTTTPVSLTDNPSYLAPSDTYSPAHARPVEKYPEIINSMMIHTNISALKSDKPTDNTPTSQAYIIAFLVDTLPRQLYLYILLRLPYLYFSRVTRIFEEAELSMPMIRQGILDAAKVKMAGGYEAGVMTRRGAFGFDLEPPAESIAYTNLQNTWQSFIDSLLREWKTLNIISVLLLSAILTILQIESAASDPLTRFSALLSMICALMSLLFGCIYIIRFGTMRKTYKGAEWAQEAQKTRTGIFWNVWVLLAMPATWLAWSMILYIITIMAFVWRTSPFPSSLSSTPDPVPTSSSAQILIPRIVITLVFSLGVVYFVLIAATLRRYGEMMDRAWQKRIWGWMRDSVSDVPRGRKKTPKSGRHHQEEDKEIWDARNRGVSGASAGDDIDEAEHRRFFPTLETGNQRSRGHTTADAVKTYQAEAGLLSRASPAMEDADQAVNSSGDDDDDDAASPNGDTGAMLSTGLDVDSTFISNNGPPKDEADANATALPLPGVFRSMALGSSVPPPKLSASLARTAKQTWSNLIATPNPNSSPAFSMKPPSGKSRLFTTKTRRKTSREVASPAKKFLRMGNVGGGVEEEVGGGTSLRDGDASFAVDASSMPVDAGPVDFIEAERLVEQDEMPTFQWKGKAKSLNLQPNRSNSGSSSEDEHAQSPKKDILLNMPSDLPADITPPQKRSRVKNKVKETVLTWQSQQLRQSTGPNPIGMANAGPSEPFMASISPRILDQEGQPRSLHRSVSKQREKPSENVGQLSKEMSGQVTQDLRTPTPAIPPASATLSPSSDEGIHSPTTSNNPPTIRLSQETIEFNGFLIQSPHRLLYRNQLYPTAMHLFEAMKYIDHRPDLAETIRNCAHVNDVYLLSLELEEFQRRDWADKYFDVLDEVLLIKFKQHPDLRAELCGTLGAKIIYTKPDNFWGIGQDGQGQNMLGRTLVRVREKLSAESL